MGIEITPEQMSSIITQAVQAVMTQQQAIQQAAESSRSTGDAGSTSSKVQWNLMKTLCPVKLDISSSTRQKFVAWERGFRSFMRETNLISDTWERQLTALQTAMSEESFLRVNSLRLQKLAAEQEQLDVVVEIAKELVESTRPLWVARHQFNHLIQNDGQTARQFYSEVAELSEDCDFTVGFCQNCQQKSLDLVILMKMVFATKSEDARKEMLKKKKLDLGTALEELEADENLKKTQEQLASQHPDVRRISRRPQKQGQEKRSTRSASRPRGGSSAPQDRCQYCDRPRHRNKNECPAYGKVCNECGGKNHFAAVCFRKSSESGQDSRSKQPKKGKKLGRIVCTIKTSPVDKVTVEIDGYKIEAEVDTGSDWCCAPVEEIRAVGGYVENLRQPTSEMMNTLNASGERMKPVGYFSPKIQFGEEEVKCPLVFFEDLSSYILSREILVKLGIVTIRTTPPESQKKMTKKITKKTSEEEKRSEKETKKTLKTEQKTSDGKIEKKTQKSEKKKIEMDEHPTSTSDSSTHQAKERLRMKKKAEDVTAEDIKFWFDDVFKCKKPLKGGPFKIELVDNATPSKVYFPRNLPIAYTEKLQEELDKLVSEGHISKVTHPTDWVSPIVIAPKKGSTAIRLCIDFRKLNQFCKREYFQSPSVIECVQTINANSASLFSVFDAKKGYHQVELAEESKDLTTFLTPFGRFRFERAPFGINAIPEHYNRRMSEALQGIPGLSRLVDDTLVYGKDAEEHLDHVTQFLERCREENIQLNIDKFIWKKPEVDFGGLKVNKDGYRMNPVLKEAIEKLPAPDTMTKMKSFHGLANQLSPFDPLLAKKLAPLRHLLKKQTSKFSMNEDEVQAFEECKRHLASSATLAFFRPGAPIQVYTDAACTLGFGFVVKQRQPDGKFKPIMVGSRSLTDAETRYAPIESEITALAWSLKKARKFLLGGPKFTVFTDHKPLVSIVNSRRLDEVANTRILRNLIKCVDFNFTVEYIRGEANIIADAFSRNPVSRPDAQDVNDSLATAFHIKAIQNTSMTEAKYTLDLENLKEVADNDPEYQKLKTTIREGFPDSKSEVDESITEFWSVREDLTVSDDDFVLYGVRLVIPMKLRRTVLQELHAGHRGIDGVKSRARLVVYWPRMDSMIEQTCRSCEKCTYDRPSQQKEPEIHLPVPSTCFEYISADFAEAGQGMKFLIITDWRSGWFSVRKMTKTNSAAVIHEIRDFFTDTMVPKVLFTDNGPPFNSAEFQSFCRRWGVRWVSSSAYYPQSNSHAENGVKKAKALLRKCVHGKTIDYEEWSRGILQIRNTPSKVTGVSPAVCVYGHSVRDTLPAHKSALSKSWHREMSLFDQKIAAERQRMDKLRPGKELPALKIGAPVVVQNRTSRRWDKYGVIQERNLKIRRYVVRMASGLITTRNRRDLRLRYPAPEMGNGTSKWSPFGKTSGSDHDHSNGRDHRNAPGNDSNNCSHGNGDDEDSDEEFYDAVDTVAGVPVIPVIPEVPVIPVIPEVPEAAETAQKRGRKPKAQAQATEVLPQPMDNRASRPKRTGRKLPVRFDDFVVEIPKSKSKKGGKEMDGT